jgi:Ca2+/Na+ antiporter
VDEIADPDNESVGETAFVVPSTWWLKTWYYFTYPLKYMIYISTPDVRRAGSEHKAILSVTISFLWVAAMTYVLIDGLSRLANMMNISGTVMGLTVGAWAASYPAAWSSIVVARNGYGDIAVCNAIGSNVFSNYIGLGLPWLTYIVVHGGNPYNALRDDGVVLSILLLGVVMVTTYLMIAWAGFTLKHW